MNIHELIPFAPMYPNCRLTMFAAFWCNPCKIRMFCPDNRLVAKPIDHPFPKTLERVDPHVLGKAVQCICAIPEKYFFPNDPEQHQLKPSRMLKIRRSHPLVPLTQPERVQQPY